MNNESLIATTTFQLLSPGMAPAPVEAELMYASQDPYAVEVVFHTGGGQVKWMFARDLLMEGLLRPSGEGDVLVRPAGDDPRLIIIVLNTPTGTALLSIVAKELAEFLDQTYDVVPPGQEDLWIDVDRELQKLVSIID